MSQYQYENVKYIYYFTDELFYKRYVFWFIEGTDNSRPALQLAVKNFDFCTKLRLLSGNWLRSTLD
jgi:hypothetical protein